MSNRFRNSVQRPRCRLLAPFAYLSCGTLEETRLAISLGFSLLLFVISLWVEWQQKKRETVSAGLAWLSTLSYSSSLLVMVCAIAIRVLANVGE